MDRRDFVVVVLLGDRRVLGDVLHQPAVAEVRLDADRDSPPARLVENGLPQSLDARARHGG